MAQTSGVHAQQPPAAGVEDNRWPDLPVASLGAWRPTERVSVIVPGYNCPDELARTLAALDAQTYPRELTEVIVADDGSDPPLAPVARPGGIQTRVVRQERDGYGAGRARNLGAQAATGAILLFLDADMVAEPWLVEAHARWHHAVGDAVVLGSRSHVDFAGLEPEDIAASGSIAGLVAGREQQPPAWLERFYERTDNLTARRSDLFAAVTASNVSVRAWLFEAVGGFGVFKMRGIEDTELGYRLFTHGALIVPDTEAFAWHQGLSHFGGPEAAASKRRRSPMLWHTIAASSIRRTTAGRRFRVPRVTVFVDADGATAEQVVASADTILAGSSRDVAVYVRIDENHPDWTYVRTALGDDDRVTGLDGGPPPRWSPTRVWAPAGACFGPDTLSRLCRPVELAQAGLVRVALPDADRAVVTAVATRALRRAGRLTGVDVEGVAPPAQAALDAVAAHFGDTWLSGSALGITDAPAEPAQDSAPAAGPGAPMAMVRALSAAQRAEARLRAERDLEQRRADAAEKRLASVERKLAALRKRKAVRLAEALGKIRRRIKA